MLPPALVLTAGLGTRLRPLTYARAKPAVPVAGEPLVRRILRWLASAGVARAVLNLHYKPETICSVVGDGADLGLLVRYSWEDPVLGSAGGPRRALPLVDADRFLIVNGDTLCSVDLEELLRAHAQTGALATLAVVPNPAPDRYGGVLVAEDGEITGFVRRGGVAPSWHFVGVQAVEAAAFASLSPDDYAETVGTLYPRLMGERPGSIRALRTAAPFRDVGTPADCLATTLELAACEHRETPIAGAGCRVAATARLTRTALWDEVEVGEHAALSECIVADRVRIPANARFDRLAIVAAEGRAASAGEERVGDLLVARLDGRPV